MDSGTSAFNWSPIILLALTSLIGVGAWIYQTALARQERRATYYASVVDSLRGFLVGEEDTEKKTAAILACRHLWIVGPPEIVKDSNKFFSAAKGRGEDAEAPLKEFILAMRRDMRLSKILNPFRTGEILPADIQFFSATIPQRSNAR